ncbi:thioesterase [Catenulispora sp. NF23]|uniref:thioesterase II family protein n=1 Tax=Catenulispora pinistramenti TaxID=2705254 RepID=UPI001BA612D5|nr:alpha/beta fold hydrolase [Catenulispora pinistramenti]MBS2531513.1 thioesterase [Catenulispora pinistramenti]
MVIRFGLIRTRSAVEISLLGGKAMVRKEKSLVRLDRQSDNSISVICIAHAGAGASAFNSWRGQPVAGASIWAARLPGRESRIIEEPLTTIEAMADSLYDPVCALQAESILVVGHCSGALIAYELTCRLAETYDAEHNLGLVVSSQHFPATADSDALEFAGLPLPQFKKELSGMEGVSESYLADESIAELVVASMRADFQAAGNYVFPSGRTRQKFAITAFGSDEDDAIAPGRLAEWQHATSGRFDVRTFPGGHFYIYEQGSAVCRALPELLPSAGSSQARKS